MSVNKKSEESILSNLTVFSEIDEEKIKWIHSRRTINDEFLSILKRENEELITDEANLHKTKGTVYRNTLYFQQQWHQIKIQLNKYIRDVIQCQRLPNLDIDKCKLHLRRILTIHGGIWEWELIIPLEPNMKQIHPLSSTNLLPCWSVENEEFIRYLTENRIIKQYCKAACC
jgi:hypothetical protein